MKTLDILYVVHGYKPAYRIGGPVHSVSGAAEALVRKGHRLTVYTTNSNLDRDLDVPLDRPVEVDGVRVHYFRRTTPARRWLRWLPYASKSIGFLYCPDMAQALERELTRFDLVHAHLPFIYPTYAASRAAARQEIPFFYHQRGVFDPERLRFRGLKKALYLRFVEQPILRRATTLIALTEFERETFRALAPETACRVVPNGIDRAAFAGARAASAEARWGIPAQATVVLFLGRLHPIKGADTLLQAFLKIQVAFPQAVLVLAGPDEWGLEAQLRESAGKQASILFPGMVEGAEKADLLARADLFCLPSAGEGFSMAVLEALASGTAVLLSPGCHFPESAAAGAGVECDATVDALATALTTLLGDPGRLKEMGKAGAAMVDRDFGWDRIADSLVELYTEGLERHGRSTSRSASR